MNSRRHVLAILLLAAGWAGTGLAQPAGSDPAVLIQQLGSLNRQAQKQARDGLLDIGLPAMPALLDAATEDRNSLVRASAVWVLWRMGRDALVPAVPTLGRALKDPDQNVREAAAYALAEVGAETRPVMPVLVEALADPYSRVRTSAAHALGRLGPEAAGAVPALIPLLREEHGTVRLAAARALQWIGPPAWPAVPALLCGLVEGPPEERRAAAEALGAISPGLGAVVVCVWPMLETVARLRSLL